MTRRGKMTRPGAPKAPRRCKKRYLVIALWDGQRWAQAYWAYSPEEAEMMAELHDDATVDAGPGVPKGGDFTIAAVIHGREIVS